MSVVTLLNQLSDNQDKVLEQEAALAERASDILASIETLKAERKALESAIKSEGKRRAKVSRKTIAGRLFNLVWSNRKPVWDEDCLKKWADEHGVEWAAFEAACKTTPEGYFSIKPK